MTRRSQQSQGSISAAEIENAIRRSGYLLEQRVRYQMEKAGYYVQTNPAYLDPDSGKSREYDISALGAVQTPTRNGEYIFASIICECKNNPQPIVFFQTESPVSFLFHEEVQCSGIPIKLWKRDRFIPLWDFFELDKFHHYVKGPFATQYCSFQFKSGQSEWMAWHSEDHHEAFSTLINAVESEKNEHYEKWVLPTRRKGEGINIQIYYPLLVVQGDLRVARETRNGLLVRSVGHVQLRKSVWSAKRKDTYQIDVVTESYVPRYLRIVEREMKSLAKRMRTHQSTIRDSLSRIVDVAHRKKKNTSLREIFEPVGGE